ncbi:site-2 protease family protein [Patescibacteria group bacterium]
MFNLLFSDPALFLIRFLALVYGITIHEFGHALAGYLQGDNTAKSMGRLTLNPLSHLDFMGTIVILLTGFFGWGKPTPYNPYNLKNKKYGSMLVGLAGPAMNLISIIIFGLALSFFSGRLPFDNLLIQFLFTLVLINIVLMVFNLIPIYPLDGSKVLFTFLGPANNFRMTLERLGPQLLLFIIIIDYIGNIGILSGMFQWVFNLVFRIFGWI